MQNSKCIKLGAQNSGLVALRVWFKFHTYACANLSLGEM